MFCRLCVQECIGNNAVELFNNTEETQLTKLIAKYLYLEVVQTDTYSTILCKDCFRHLNDFHKFVQYVEQRQKELSDNFMEIKLVIGSTNYISSNENNEAVDKLFNVAPNEESLLDIKDVLVEEYNAEIEKLLPEEEFGYASLECNGAESDESNNHEDDLPLKELIKKTKKTKPKTQLKNIKKSKSTKNVVKNSNKRKTKEYSCKSKKSSLTNISNTINEQHKNGEETTQYSNEDEEEEETLSTTEEDKLKDELISKHIQLKCEICEIVVKTYKDLLVHFRKDHKRRAFIICCGMRFLQRFALADHIQTHLDPDYFRCKICGKLLKSRICLELHNSNKHSDRQQQKHVCKICDKRFIHLSFLNTHMMIHSDQRNHICEICKKGYKTINALRSHINHMHGERSTYVCDTCGKKYRFKLSFDQHVAEHQGIPIENKKCPLCGKWVSITYIKRHIKSHKFESVNCEICGKTVKSERALKDHIKYWHGTKKLYPCTYCDKTFERPRYLKEHIDMHTGQKDYNCPHCPREFRSRSNMYSHIKKAHFEQWSQAQQERAQGSIKKKINSKEIIINSAL